MKKQEFVDALNAKGDLGRLEVLIKLPTGAIETIINTEDIAEKVSYYLNAYDDEMRLKAKPEIQMVGFNLSNGPRSFIRVQFQNGPINEVGVNGCQIDDVIDVLIERLTGFQKGAHPCRENALAITKLEEAKHWLEHRTKARKAQGVEGHMKSHN